MNEEQRGNLYLLTGLIIGLAIGLAIAWGVSPVQYVDTLPDSLAPEYKDAYRQVIALAYLSNPDLERARERLSLLDSQGQIQLLAAQAQRMLAENQLSQDARALAILAADLGKPEAAAARPTGAPTVVSALTQPPTALPPTPTREVAAAVQTPTAVRPTATPAATATPVPTFTPRPSSTPASLTESLYTLEESTEICSGTAQPGLLQIEVLDSEANPKAGVKIFVTWEQGEDVFFTGMAPEVSAGYADFQMSGGLKYSVRVGSASKEVTNISVPNCNGARKLVFREINGN